MSHTPVQTHDLKRGRAFVHKEHGQCVFLGAHPEDDSVLLLEEAEPRPGDVPELFRSRIDDLAFADEGPLAAVRATLRPTLNLLMAVSSDGMVCRGPSDDMRWTGRTDKALFRALTLPDQVLLAGRTTAAMLPKLPGRTVVPISRDPGQGLDLAVAAQRYPGAWLIGGPTVAQEALGLGLVRLVYECRGLSVTLEAGVPWRPIERWLDSRPRVDLHVDTVRLRVWEARRSGS